MTKCLKPAFSPTQPVDFQLRLGSELARLRVLQPARMQSYAEIRQLATLTAIGTSLALQSPRQITRICSVDRNRILNWRREMLNLAVTLLILALIAAVLGFGGLAAGIAGIAKILFFVFIVLFLISAVAAALRGRAPV